MFHRTYRRYIVAVFAFVLFPWATLHANSLFAVDPGSTATTPPTSPRIVEFDVGSDPLKFGTIIREFPIPEEALPTPGLDLGRAGLAYYESIPEGSPASTPESSLFFVNGTNNQLYQFSLTAEALTLMRGPIQIPGDSDYVYTGLAVSDGVLYALGINNAGSDQIVALDASPLALDASPLIEARPTCSTGLRAIDVLASSLPLAPSLSGSLLTADDRDGVEITTDLCIFQGTALPNIGAISGLAYDNSQFYVATSSDGSPSTISIYDGQALELLRSFVSEVMLSGLAASQREQDGSN